MKVFLSFEMFKLNDFFVFFVINLFIYQHYKTLSINSKNSNKLSVVGKLVSCVNHIRIELGNICVLVKANTSDAINN